MPAERFSLRSALLNFFFPPLCFCCGALVTSQTDTLCPPCRARATLLTTDDPLFSLAWSRICGDGLCEDLVSGFRFEKDGPVQALLHALKYRGGEHVGRSLGAQVGALVRERAWAPALNMIVPLPLHTAKFRERGYNQAEQCALGMAAVLGTPVRRSGVRRIRWTRSQTTLAYAERQENVEAAFLVSPGEQEFLRGKKILLVDDVITTGATIRACATALARCKPGGLYVASIALAEQ